MEVKKNRLNADFDKIPEAVERIFKNKRIAANLKLFRSRQPALFNIAIVMAIVVIVVMYLLSPMSSVRAVSIQGSTYLSDDYIKTIAGVNTSSKLYFTIPVLVERKLEVNPLIEDAKVTLNNGNTVTITVKEKKLVGYQSEGNGTIWFGNGEATVLDDNNRQVIASIPKLIGFTDTELLKKVSNALNEIDDSILQQISTISVYPLRYDAHALLVHMRIGSYFVASYSNLKILNDYFTIYSQATDKTKCLWGTSKDQVAYTAACPWEQKESEKATAVSDAVYWHDSEGNVRLDANGLPIEKHFYTDAEGNVAVDANGSPIAIPIDDNGIEIIDDKFQENYAAGYYTTGVLNTPTPAQ